VPPAQKIISLCALRGSAVKKYYSEYVTVIPNLCTKQNGSLLGIEFDPMGISSPVGFKKPVFECRIGRLAGCSRSAILMNPYHYSMNYELQDTGFPMR
jgi:hypothetical protein